MKWLLSIPFLISNIYAFQVAPSTGRVTTALHFYPRNFERAVECATHNGECNVDELEELAAELEDFQTSATDNPLQCRDHYKDTAQVKDMLRMQTELNRLQNEFAVQKQGDDSPSSLKQENFSITDDYSTMVKFWFCAN